MRHPGPAALLFVILVVACAPPDDAATAADAAVPANEAAGAEATAATVPAELEARAEAFTAAWNQDDPAVIAGFFTANATLVAADTASFNGRQDILDRWIRPGVAAESTLRVQDQVWEAAGDDFRSSGRFTYAYTTPEGDGGVSGRYETVWTRDTDGQWRVSRMTSTADPEG